MDFPIFVITWVALILAYLGVAGYRWFLTRHEDDMVHVRDSEAKLIPVQTAFAHRIHHLDLWSRVLVVTAVVYGLALGAFYVYQQFVHGSRLSGS